MHGEDGCRESTNGRRRGWMGCHGLSLGNRILARTCTYVLRTCKVFRYARVAAHPVWMYIRNKTCSCGQFSTLHVAPPPTLWGARGRHEVGRGSPAIHASLMNFTCRSEKPCTYVRVCVLRVVVTLPFFGLESVG